MAKVLPAGANVNLGLGKDPMDRLVQTVDLAMKVGGAFQKNQDRRRTNSSNEMSDLMTMLTNGSQYLSGDDYQKIGNQIKNATSSARSIGTPTLTTQANLLENVHESMSQSNTEYENSLLTFNNDFMNLDIFNQSNYTDADGNPNMEFLNEINAKGIDWFNETQSKLSNYQRQLFTVGGNGELIPKRNNQASRKAQADYQKTQNMFYNLYDSRLNNVISEDEFVYITQNGGLSNKQLDSFREIKLDFLGKQLSDLERQITNSNKTLSNLNINKDKQLRSALKSNDSDLPSYIIDWENSTGQKLSDSDKQLAGDLTPSNYDSGSYFDEEGNAQEIPQKVAELYDTLIKESKLQRDAVSQLYFDRKDEFDFWSPFNYDSKNNSDLFGKGTFETKNPAPMTDVDEDGIPLGIDNDDDTNYILNKETVAPEAPAAETPVENNEDLVELENKDDFQKLGINISGNLTKSNVERIKAELMEIFNNSTSDTNFVKLQSLKRANDAINKVVPKESVEQPALNEKQLKQAVPAFANFKNKTKNKISDIKDKIKNRKASLGRMTGFNKDSVERQKNKLSVEIKSLENELAKQQSLLNDVDMNTWLNTVANKNMAKRIKKGQYWKF
jgi:hypothetical protein